MRKGYDGRNNARIANQFAEGPYHSHSIVPGGLDV